MKGKPEEIAGATDEILRQHLAEVPQIRQEPARVGLPRVAEQTDRTIGETQRYAGVLEERMEAVPKKAEQEKEFEEKSNAVSTWAEDIPYKKARDVSIGYRDAVDATARDLSAFGQEIKERGEIAKEKYHAMEEQVAYVERADRTIHGIADPAESRGTSTVYARGLVALREGKSEESKIQEFLAREYSEAGQRGRSQIEGWSAGLASGEMTIQQVMQQAGEYLAGQAERTAKKAPGGDQLPISGIAEALRSGDITLEDLQRGRAAVDLIGDYEKSRSAIWQPAAREGNLAIYQRAFTALEQGDMEQAGAQATLAQMHAKPKSYVLKPSEEPGKRAEIDAVSQGLADGTIKQESAGAYIHISAKRAGLREERRKYGSGTAQEQLYDRPISFMDDLSAKIANGDGITENQMRAYTALTQLHSQNDIPAIMKGGSGAVRILDSAQEAITRSAVDPAALAEAPAHILAATAYAKAKTKDEKAEIASISERVAARELTADAGGWLAKTQLDRVNAQGAAKDKEEQERIGRYYGMAIAAYENRDLVGADAMGQLAGLYAGAVSAGADDTIQFVRSVMETPGIEKSFSDGLKKAKDIPDRIASVPKEKRVEAVIIEIARHSARMEIEGKGDRAAKIAGGTAARQTYVKKVYETQQAKHERLAIRAEERGDKIEAERQRKEAARIDYDRINERVAKTIQAYEEALALVEEAADLRLQALGETGKTAGKTDDEANKKAGLALTAMQLCESELAALEQLHASIYGIRTIQSERGRMNFDRAAAAYAEARRDIARKKEPSEAKLRQADSDMQKGMHDTAVQRSVQTSIEIRIARIETLKRQNEVHAEAAGSKREGGPVTHSRDVVSYETSERGIPVIAAGTRIVDDESRAKEIEEAGRAVNAERFGTADHLAAVAQTNIVREGNRIRTESGYLTLRGSAPPVTLKPSGDFVTETRINSRRELVAVGFDYNALMLADTGTFDSQYSLAVTTQHLLNAKARKENQRGFVANAGESAKQAGTISTGERESYGADQAAAEAHGANKKAVFEAAGLGHLASWAEDIGRDIDRSLTSIESAMSRIVEQGHADGMIDEGNMPLLLYGAEQAGINVSGFYGIMAEEGEGAAFARFLAGGEDTEKAVNWLRENGKINDAQAEYLISRSMDSRSNTRVQEYTAGYQVAMAGAQEAVNMLDVADRHEREKGSDPRITVMRTRAARMTAVAGAVAANPEQAMHAMERGEQITMGKVNVKIREGVAMSAGSQRATVPGAIYTELHGFASDCQAIGSSGGPTAAEQAELIARGKAPGAKEARQIAAAYTATIMARAGIARDGDSWTKVELTGQEQQTVDRIASGSQQTDSVEGLYAKFVEASLSTTGMMAATERDKMFSDTAAQASLAQGEIGKIHSNAIAGMPPIEIPELEAAEQRVAGANAQYRIAYEESARSAGEWDSVERGAMALGEMGLGIAITATGVGAGVGLGFSLRAAQRLHDDTRRSGGWSQMQTSGKIMGVAGIAIGAGGAAFAQATAFAQSAQQLGRVGTITQAFTQTGIATKMMSPALITAGFALGGYGAYESLGAWSRGEMGTFEFMSAGVVGSFQQMVPIGFAVKPTQHLFQKAWVSNTTTAKLGRIALTLTTGETRASLGYAGITGHPDYLASFNSVAQFHADYQRLTPKQRQVYHNVEARIGTRLYGEEGNSVIQKVKAGESSQKIYRSMSPEGATPRTEAPKAEAPKAGATREQTEAVPANLEEMAQAREAKTAAEKTRTEAALDRLERMAQEREAKTAKPEGAKVVEFPAERAGKPGEGKLQEKPAEVISLQERMRQRAEAAKAKKEAPQREAAEQPVLRTGTDDEVVHVGGELKPHADDEITRAERPRAVKEETPAEKPGKAKLVEEPQARPREESPEARPMRPEPEERTRAATPRRTPAREEASAKTTREEVTVITEEKPVFTSPEESAAKARQQYEMTPEQQEAASAADAAVRGDPEAVAKIAEWKAAGDRRADAMDVILSPENMEHWRSATPEEREFALRALLAENDGQLQDAVRYARNSGNLKKHLDPDSNPLLKKMGQETRMKMIGEIDELGRAVDRAEPGPAKQKAEQNLERGLNEAVEALRIEREQNIIDRAKAAETPEQQRANDIEAIGELAAATSRDPGRLTEVYQEAGGGTEGRIKVFEELGIVSFSDHKKAISSLQDSLGTSRREIQKARQAGDIEAENRHQRKQNETERDIAERQSAREHAAASLWELITRGRVMEVVEGMPQYAGYEWKAIEHFGGAGGVFVVKLQKGSNTKRVIITPQDAIPHAYGVERARAEGLISGNIHSSEQNPKLAYAVEHTDPATGRKLTEQRSIGIIEPVETVEGQTVIARLPSSGEFETVTVQETGIVKELLHQWGMEGAVRPENLPEGSMQREFVEMMSSPPGRQEIMRAWRAYHELCRRAGLMDRNARNTSMVMVKRNDGTSEITFQPIDMDGINSRVGTDREGAEYRYAGFDDDFASGTVNLFVHMDKAARRMGLGDVNLSSMYRDYFSPFAEQGSSIPPNSPEVIAQVEAIIRRHDGKPVGIGFNVRDTSQAPVGGLISQNGRSRFVERGDGRVRSYADEGIAIYRQQNVPAEREGGRPGASRQNEFNERQTSMVARKVGKHVIEYAKKVAEKRNELLATKTPEEAEAIIREEFGDRSGYELIDRYSRSSRFLALEESSQLGMIAQELLLGPYSLRDSTVPPSRTEGATLAPGRRDESTRATVAPPPREEATQATRPTGARKTEPPPTVKTGPALERETSGPSETMPPTRRRFTEPPAPIRESRRAIPPPPRESQPPPKFQEPAGVTTPKAKTEAPKATTAKPVETTTAKPKAGQEVTGPKADAPEATTPKPVLRPVERTTGPEEVAAYNTRMVEDYNAGVQTPETARMKQILETHPFHTPEDVAPMVADEMTAANRLAELYPKVKDETFEQRVARDIDFGAETEGRLLRMRRIAVEHPEMTPFELAMEALARENPEPPPPKGGGPRPKEGERMGPYGPIIGRGAATAEGNAIKIDFGKKAPKGAQETAVVAEQAAGERLVAEQNLETAGGLAHFARRMVRGDESAKAGYQNLPPEVRQAVDGLTANTKFSMNASGLSDKRFDAFIGNPRQGKPIVETARAKVLTRPTKEPEAARATGTEGGAVEHVGASHVERTEARTARATMESAAERARAGPPPPPPSSKEGAQAREGTAGVFEGSEQTAGKVREKPAPLKIKPQEARKISEEIATRLALRDEEAEMLGKFLEEHPEQAADLEAQVEMAQEKEIHEARVRKAKAEETPEQIRERNLELLGSEQVQAIAQRRKNPPDLQAAYQAGKPKGGIAGRLAKMRSKGADAADARQEVFRQMDIELNDLVASDADDFFHMFFDGDLEGRIREMPGFDNVTVSSVEKSGLGTGTFVVKLSDGRKVFVTPFSGEADVLGARLSTARGTPTIEITTESNGRPLTFKRQYTSETETTHYNISVDVHDFVGRSRAYIADSGEAHTGRITSVADFKKGVLRREPGSRMDATTEEAVRTFYDMLGTREGMETLLRRFLRFQEDNFRNGLSDLHEGNMYIEIIEGPNGPELVFGRLDTDPFGMGLRTGENGRPDVDLFIGDFSKRTTGIIDEMVRASAAARENKGGAYNDVQGNPVYTGKEWTRADAYGILLEILGEGSGGFSRTNPKVETETRRVVAEHVGRQFTMAYSKRGVMAKPDNRSAGMVRIPTEDGGRSVMTQAQADFITGELFPALAAKAGELRQDNIRLVIQQGMGDVIAKGEPLPAGIFSDVAANLRADERFAGASSISKGMIAEAAASNAFELQTQPVASRMKLAKEQGMETVEVVAQYDSMGTIREWGPNTKGTPNRKEAVISIDAETGRITEVSIDGPGKQRSPALSSLEGATIK